MFKVKFILVLALLALVAQDEVKCITMDELMTELVKLSATLKKGLAAFDQGEEKQATSESGTHTDHSDALDETAEKKEAIESGTYTDNADALDETAEKKEAIESGTHTEVAGEIDRSAEIEEGIRTGTFSEKEEAIQTGTFSEAPTGTVNPIRAGKSSIGDVINDAICGTRSTSLSHSILEPARIVGGADAKPGDLPWQVGFTGSSGSTFIYCGGTLISNEWIVSAAHCFKPGQKPWVRLGEHDKRTNEGREQVIQASQVHIHPRYHHPKNLDNDIALIQLSKKATINKYVRPACLPSSDFVVNSGIMATISGWGTLKSGGSTAKILQVAQVPIVDPGTCSRNYPGQITNTMICAGYQKGGIDACQGDSGGPLVVKNGTKYFLIGDTSWGAGCARAGKPGVYCRITAVRSWIDSVIPNTGPAPTVPPAPTPKPTITTQDRLTCNFEKDLCKWTQSKSDQFDWDRRKGATASSGTGPSESSTGANGHYMFIETSYPRKQGDAATLISPEINYATQTCLSFKAHMHGQTIADLRIEKVVGGSKTRIFEKSGKQGSSWLSFNVDLPKGGPYKIAITATRGGSYTGDIAIDELKQTLRPCGAPAPPAPGPPVPGPTVDLLTCNFDKDVCKWKQSTSDQDDWQRRKGATPSSNTGPTTSATGSNGYYMYIETSYPRKQGDAATLISPEVTYATQTCLSFKAHMYGETIDALRIEKVVGASKTKIFEKSGNQGNKWLSFTVNLPIGGPYKVAITATRGGSYTGDIAIDELKQTPCGLSPDAPQLASCNFEKDMCKWTQSKADKFDWTRRQGTTPSSSTGPSGSSTDPKDYYLFIETSYPRNPGDKAILASPNIRSASKACLQFKAHMYGRGIGALKIETVKGRTRTTIFSKSGDQGNTWQSYNVDLPAGGPYKVEITGTRGGSYEGDIAIDELLVTPSPCSAPSPSPTPSPAKGCGNPSIKSKISATRVIGGVEATRGCWPWQILMFYNNGYICGGSLISKDWVVTAAHCVEGKLAQHIKIRVGEQDRRKPEGSEDDIPVKKIITHPRYKLDGHQVNNDIALMQLSREAKFNQYVKPVSLPKKDIPAGSYCYITGFGKMQHPGKSVNTLQQARLFVPSNKVCDGFNKRYNSLGVNGNMICGGDGSKLGGCHGDSGGPFVCDVNGKWELHGAVSWGDATCNPKKAYTVFARITKYLDWIKQNSGITG